MRMWFLPFFHILPLSIGATTRFQFFKSSCCRVSCEKFSCIKINNKSLSRFYQSTRILSVGSRFPFLIFFLRITNEGKNCFYQSKFAFVGTRTMFRIFRRSNKFTANTIGWVNVSLSMSWRLFWPSDTRNRLDSCKSTKNLRTFCRCKKDKANPMRTKWIFWSFSMYGIRIYVLK